MNSLFAAAIEIQTFCRDRDWAFCIIGGLAVQRWGEPRLTRDVDLTLLTGFGFEEPFVEELLGSFKGRLPDARTFALDNRVLLLASSGAAGRPRQGSVREGMPGLRRDTSASASGAGRRRSSRQTWVTSITSSPHAIRTAWSSAIGSTVPGGASLGSPARRARAIAICSSAERALG